MINTCTVTAEAERKCRQQIRKLAKANPQAQIVAMGCYAQVAPEELQLPGVKFVVGTTERSDILALLEGAPPRRHVAALGQGLTFEDLGPGLAERTRATLKIEDGCDEHCTYCRVRLARGPVRSLPERRVLELAEEFAGRGCKEIVLSGVNLGSWGRDLPGRPQFWQLLESLARLPELVRIRLSSIEPPDVTERLLEVMASHRTICNHIHLPLQSGSGKVLKLMGRPYTPEGYARIVANIRKFLPQAGLTTDVMVAFPGEGEAEFLESTEFVEKMAFSRLHVFPYSKRPGTAALRLPGHLPRQEGHRRSQRLIALGQRLAEQYHRQFVGRDVEIVLERQAAGLWEGITGEYVRVRAAGQGETGQVRTAHVESWDQSGLLGALR